MASNFRENLKKKIQGSPFNFNIKQLEREAGLSVSSIQKILQGHTKNPGIETLWSIARALNCPIEHLIRDDYPESESQSSSSDPLIPELYIKCVTFSITYFTDNNVKISLFEAMDLIKEIYTYCLTQSDNSLDVRFARWFLNKHFSKNTRNWSSS